MCYSLPYHLQWYVFFILNRFVHLSRWLAIKERAHESGGKQSECRQSSTGLNRWTTSHTLWTYVKGRELHHGRIPQRAVSASKQAHTDTHIDLPIRMWKQGGIARQDNRKGYCQGFQGQQEELFTISENKEEWGLSSQRSRQGPNRKLPSVHA